MKKERLKVMIVQEAAVYNDLNASLKLLKNYLGKAGKSGVDLVIFGETWLTGYPAWLDCANNISNWDDPSLKSVYSEIWKQSISLQSDEFRKLGQMISQSGVMVCIGANEKVESGPGNRSLFNSFFIFSSEGNLLHHHRKLMPTHTERLIHALGDPRGLKTIDSPWGKIGGLICWEHWMPLARQALHNEGEHIHIALWPKVHEMLQVASRHYAFEGRCFVIAVGQVLKREQLPKQLKYPSNLNLNEDQYVLDGQSCIFGPDGSILMTPQGPEQKEIIFEIKDLSSTIREQMTLDVAGHYSRPDIFNFTYRSSEDKKKR